MTTAAAIDRLVHHAIILEMTGPSFRTEQAKERQHDTALTTKAKQSSELPIESVIAVDGQADDVKK